MGESLPQGYDDLEPFVARWSVSGLHERAQLRRCTQQERRDFYEAVKDRIGPALAELESKPLGALSPCERRLLNLLLSFTHVALTVEAGAGAD